MPILLFLLITALNTEFYIFLLYTFLLFSPPTLETAQVREAGLKFNPSLAIRKMKAVLIKCC